MFSLESTCKYQREQTQPIVKYAGTVYPENDYSVKIYSSSCKIDV